MVRPAARFSLTPLQPGLCADCPVRKFAAYSGVPADTLKFLPQFQVLENLAAEHSDACVILITGHGDAATKARATRAGAAAML